MLDKDFLSDLLGKEDVSTEDKIKSILSEHESDTRGLKLKRDELLGSEKKLKDKIKEFEERETGLNSQITSLKDELAKNDPENRRKIYEAREAELIKKHQEELAEVSQDRDRYKASHLERLKNDAINEGIKGIQFVDGLRDGFIATVMYKNKFEAKDVDGKLMFVDNDGKTIQDVMGAFAKTPEGKAYIKNPSSGGGASGGGGGGASDKVMKRSDFEALGSDEKMKFFKDGGKVIS